MDDRYLLYITRNVINFSDTEGKFCVEIHQVWPLMVARTWPIFQLGSVTRLGSVHALFPLFKIPLHASKLNKFFAKTALMTVKLYRMYKRYNGLVYPASLSNLSIW